MEDKDIKIIKDLINDLKQQETITGYNAEIEIQALENLLQGYKQDEKVIDEMAEELAPLYGKQGAIDYFRKKCE